jgi:drug/metabolite transporter (DMT)-like permease
MNRFRADLVLLMVALIWGSAFAVQRVATRYFDAFMFNGLRFLLGGLVLFPFSRFNPLNKANRARLGSAQGMASTGRSSISSWRVDFYSAQPAFNKWG